MKYTKEQINRARQAVSLTTSTFDLLEAAAKASGMKSPHEDLKDINEQLKAEIAKEEPDIGKLYELMSKMEGRTEELYND